MCSSDLALLFFFFFFKQKTAYEIKECDWSSDVCSSDLFQRWLQRPIGEYFAEREILQPGEIRHLVQIIRRRNARFGDANP